LARVDLARVVDLAAALDADAHADPMRCASATARSGARSPRARTTRPSASRVARRAPRSGPTTASARSRAGRAAHAARGCGRLLGATTAFAVFAYDGGRP
jgi:hypothetical protein